MDDDENISTLLSMGFPDLGLIKRALRMANNDLNEAVAILTNESTGDTRDTGGGSGSNAQEVFFGPVNKSESASKGAQFG